MNKYAKFTTISLMITVRTKREKKAENLKFEIWFTEDQDVHMR